MTRSARRLRALLALVALAILVVGVPLLLVRIASWPLPHAVPDWRIVRIAIQQGNIPSKTVIKAIAVVVWIAWAQLAWAFVWEVAANLRYGQSTSSARTVAGSAPLVPVAVGTGMGRLVAMVFAFTMTMTSSPGGSLARPAVAVEMPVNSPSTRMPVSPSRTVTPATSAPEWCVALTDTMWDIAEIALGDGSRSSEILQMNGHVRSVRDLAAGDILRMPVGAVIPSDRRPTVASHSTSMASTDAYLPPTTIVVERGDNIWNLSQDRLDLAHEAPVAERQTLDYVREVIVANRDVVEDPNLIYPGEVLDFPAIGTPPPSPPPEPAAPDLPPAKDPKPVVPDTAEAPPSAVPATSAPARTTVPPTVPTSAPAPTTTVPGTAPSAVDSSSTESTTLRWLLGGGATVLATGILVALRRRQQQARARGIRPSRRQPQLERDLVRAADLPLARWANHELAELCKRLDPRRVSSVPVAMEVSAEHGIELLWDSPTTAAPAPWEAADDGWAWRLLYDPDLRLPSEPEPAPIPGFVTLGRRDGNLLLVNIEAFGGLAITGDAAGVDELTRSIVAEFAHGEEFANSLVTVVGSEFEVAGSERIDGSDVATAAELVSATVRQHDAVLDRAGFVNTFQLRMRGDASDRHLFVITELDDTDKPAVRPNRGVAILSRTPNDGLAEVKLDESGAVLEPLGVRFTPTGISSAELEEVNDLIEMADEDLEPIDEFYDDEPFAVAPDDLEEDGIEETAAIAEVGETEDEEPKLIVRVLGRPSIDGYPDIGRIEMNIIAYLACNGHRADSDKLLDAVWNGKWISPGSFANRLSKLRRALPDFIAPRDPTDRVVVLDRRVVADTTIIERRLRAASCLPDEQASPLLSEALSYVSGVPFDEPGYEWAHQGLHVRRAEDLIRRLVESQVELAARMSDLKTASQALELGQLTLPGDESVLRTPTRAPTVERRQH